jgi:OHCU decarboxylase
MAFISTREEFVALFGAVFEHSPWIADRAWAQPFPLDAEAAHSAMVAVLRAASLEEQLTLIRLHPELAGQEAVSGALSQDSSSEQGRLGFSALSHDEFERMQHLNRRYREKFGFPCIVALRLHASRSSVMHEMEAAIHRSAEDEIGRALDQIGEIARGRIEKITAAARSQAIQAS